MSELDLAITFQQEPAELSDCSAVNSRGFDAAAEQLVWDVGGDVSDAGGNTGASRVSWGVRDVEHQPAESQTRHTHLPLMEPSSSIKQPKSVKSDERHRAAASSHPRCR